MLLSQNGLSQNGYGGCGCVGGWVGGWVGCCGGGGCGGCGGDGGADLSVDGRSLSMNHHARAINLGGRTLGRKLPASPPPLPRPDGGGQPCPCTCVHGPKKTPHELVIAMMS